MNKLVVAAATLVALVVGLVVFTTLDSSAQESDESPMTTTTVLEDEQKLPDRFDFGFRFDGELPAEVDEFLTCLADQGIDVPDDIDRGFWFDLRSEDFAGLAEALEVCEFPIRPFVGGLFDRIPFGDELPEGFPFEGLPEDFFDQLPEGFPFGDGIPFEGLPEDFLDELPEGFPFGRFEFHGPRPGLDRDALAECLAELGSFDSVAAVRDRLDVCLPEGPDFTWESGAHRFGFDFDGFFGFEEIEPQENASA